METSTIKFEDNVANGVDIDVAYDVRWMEVYHFRFYQLKQYRSTEGCSKLKRSVRRQYKFRKEWYQH